MIRSRPGAGSIPAAVTIVKNTERKELKMTKEEYYKSQLCAQAFRAEVRKNHLLRQKLAGVDPESLQQAEEDREAFALVAQKRARMQMLAEEQKRNMQVPSIGIRLLDTEEDLFDEERFDTRLGIANRIAAAAIAAGILLMPLLWVLG